jgi:WD40 repeat protein
VAIATQIRRLRLDGSVLVRHELLLALARLFFHPEHSLPLQAVAYTIDRMERRLRGSKKNRQAAKNGAKSKGGKGGNTKTRSATPMAVPEKNDGSSRSGMEGSGAGEGGDFSLDASSGPLQSPIIPSVSVSASAASPRTIGSRTTTGASSVSAGSSIGSAAGSPRSPTKHHHGSSPRLSSIASGTIASIEAALGGDKQGAIGYMQIWKTVRQMQLRDPFPEIKRIAGILIHEVLSKLSRNSPLKARLGGRSYSSDRKTLKVMPSSGEIPTDSHSVIKGAGNRTKIASILGLSSSSSASSSLDKPPTVTRSSSSSVAGVHLPPALLQRSKAQSSLESYRQQAQHRNSRAGNVSAAGDKTGGSGAARGVFDLPLPVFEHDALDNTLRALDLDPDRLYALSVKRFTKPMTVDRGDTKLYICLDDDDTAIAGRDPLTANQARRAWHQQRNDRIAEQAKTMFPKGMFFDSNQSGPAGLDDEDMQAHDATPSIGEGVTRRLKAASALSSKPSNNKDGGGDGDSKSQAFNRFEQSAILDCESEATSLLLFHPFEAVLVMADLRDGLSVWNYGSGKKLSRFSNCNRPGTRITSLQWVNEQEPTRLMTGSDDGVVRVWCGTKLMSEIQAINEVEERQESVFQALEQAGFISGIDRSKSDQQSNPAKGRKQGSNKGNIRGGVQVRSPAQMLTAWKAAPDVNPGARGSGLILKWQQLSGRLFAAGNSSVIRVWDMFREQCISTIPSGADTCVTAMGSDWNSDVGGGEGVVMCGYGDGSLRMFDARLPPDVSNVLTYIEHSTWVVNVEMQRGGGKHIISGAVSGEIKFWDVRRSGGGGYRHRPSSTKTIELHRSPMVSVA